MTATEPAYVTGTGEQTFLQLVEEGAKLLETLGVVEERVGMAEQCRDSIEAEHAAVAKEVARKHAILVKYWAPPEARERLQSIAEDTMLLNVGLKDQNRKLLDKVSNLTASETDLSASVSSMWSP